MLKSSLRYQFAHKTPKINCPSCFPRHHKTLRRWIDTRTRELLPEQYGICDKPSCGYKLSPYDKDTSGKSYATRIFDQFKIDNPWPNSRPAARRSPRLTKVSQHRVRLDDPPVVCCIPDELVQQSLSRYDQNQLAILLREYFGMEKAQELLEQFLIGTAEYWPKACVFWYIDERGRVRGGQIKQLGPDGHTVKGVNRRSNINWVHTVLQRQFQKAGKPLPTWLQSYIENGAKASPCLYGLPQLWTAPPDIPVAIVEAPKTAIIAAACYPNYVWLAVGAKDYLTPERLAPVRHRSLLLVPDLDAYFDKKNGQGRIIQGWLSKAADLERQGFNIEEVFDISEGQATEEQREKGLDLADFILKNLSTSSPECSPPINGPRIVTEP